MAVCKRIAPAGSFSGKANRGGEMERVTPDQSRLDEEQQPQPGEGPPPGEGPGEGTPGEEPGEGGGEEEPAGPGSPESPTTPDNPAEGGTEAPTG
jgi:hypothetical protein